MIRIAISQAAFEAIAATLPFGSTGYENAVNDKGERLIWLERRMLHKLNSIAGVERAKGLQISHEGAAGVLRSRSAS